MKIKEIIEMTTDELLTRKRDLRQESLHLRLQQQSGQLEQPSRLRLLRRDVAKIETVPSQRAAKGEKKKNRRRHKRIEGGNSHDRARDAKDADRRGDLKRDEQDDRGADGDASAAREVREDREADEEILRARRGEQGETRRYGADHGNAADEQAETLAAGGRRP